jgi:outer membrane protein TolC
MRIFLLFTIVIFASTLNAYAIKSLSIEECVEIALKNDPQIKIMQGHQRAAKSRLGVARSDYFPSLTGATGYLYQNNSATTSRGTTVDNASNYRLNLGVNQHIWNFGRSTARINMQKYNLEASGHDLNQTILNTTYRTKIAYYAVLAAIASMDISTRTVETYKLHSERTKAMFEEGLRSKIDVVNAEVNLTDARIQLLNAQNAYQLALINLNNAMFWTSGEKYTLQNTENFHFHQSPDTVSKNIYNISYRQGEGKDAVLRLGVEKNNILENYSFTPFDLNVEEAIERAYQKRPDLLSLNLVHRAQEESLKAVRRSFYPSLSAGAGFNANKNFSNDNHGNSFNISAGLDFPLINAMEVKNRVDEGKSYLEIAAQNIDLLTKSIYFEVQNNYINMLQLEMKLPLLEAKVRATLENFELADGRYSVGLGNFIELQDAQESYNSAQLAFVKCVFDYNVARETLIRSIGGTL